MDRTRTLPDPAMTPFRTPPTPSTEPSLERATDHDLWQALGDANIPVLLMLLAQLTGDDRWLAPPYAPTRTRGMDDNDTGGLSEALQNDVRRATFELLRRDPGPTLNDAVDPPGATELARLMTICMGEEVPPEYGELMLEEMGFSTRQPQWPRPPDPERLNGFRALIIGAGASGICAAVGLRRAGIPFVVYERSDSIGGTWSDNTYPGCGVDTPSHLYSFSFAPANWSRYFARQPEILAYLERCVDQFEVRDRIELATTVLAADYDELRGCWTVRCRRADGSERSQQFDVVISAVGQLNVPSIPAFEGADRFAGPQVHSARWPDDLDVGGRTVAVVGTGASAMQLVPALAEAQAQIKLFQRSPQWAVPADKYRRDVPSGVRYLIDRVPLYGAWYRSRLAWSSSDTVHASLRLDPEWAGAPYSINAANSGHRRFLTRHLAQELSDRPDLIAELLPRYPPFAKRMLLDNGWYRCLARPEVKLVSSGISAIVPDGIVDDAGTLHRADVIVYATGFQTLRMLGSYDVRGRGGVSLRDRWGEDDARAYLGITVPEFPNFFCLYGPNTGLGHGGSAILLSECSTRYVVSILQQMIVDELRTVEVRQDVFHRYNDALDAAHEGMIWSHPSTTNWYRNAAGRVVTNMPWRVVDYWRMTRTPQLSDFRSERADSPASPQAESLRRHPRSRQQ